MMTELHYLSLFVRAIAKVLGMTGLGMGGALALIAEYPYVYRWAKYLGLPVLGGKRKGQPCKVIVRGKRNSCLIEFPDGRVGVCLGCGDEKVIPFSRTNSEVAC